MENLKKAATPVVLLAALAGGVIGGVLGVSASPYIRGALRLPQPGISPSGTGAFIPPEPVLGQRGGIAEDEQTIAVVERVQNSVVSIAVTKDLPAQPPVKGFEPFNSPFTPFFDAPEPEGKQKLGGGSGFFVSADGLIVTNRHVVSDPAAEYTVVLPDGRELPAKVLARDPVLDIAVIDVEGDGYPYVTFGDSDELKLGQTVIAIGNALDQFRNTVTKGIVSGLNRRIVAQDFTNDAEVLEEAIQTDAAINPGNSGGPLIDLHGRVVGVNTAVSLSGQLIGFALPGNLAKRDVEQVQKIGRVARPFLGVRYLIINNELKERNQLTVENGVLISRGQGSSDVAIVPGSPADKAGLEENDIILSVDGIKVDEGHGLSSLIGRKSPGDTVKLKVLHRGEVREAAIILGEFKPQN